MADRVQLVEYVTSSAVKVNVEKGLIEDVKLLGKNSANGRTYSEAALQKAIKDKLYEGRPVNVNHPQRGHDSRSAYDRFGRIVSPRVESDGIYGTLEYLKAHPLAAPLAEAAQRMPSIFGMSHVATGKEEKRAGQSIVEEIEAVSSVDVVADPATTKGLFESQGHSMKKTVKDVYLEAFKADAKKLKLVEDLPPDAAAVAMPAEGGSDVDAAFKAMICGVFDDSKLDTAGKIAKIKEILKAHEKLTAKEAPASEKPAGDASASEGAKADLAANLSEQLAVRDLIEDAGLKFAKPESRKAFIKSLIPLSESERTALIEERKSQAEQNGKQDNPPRSAGRTLTEGKGLDVADPKNFSRECFGAAV